MKDENDIKLAISIAEQFQDCSGVNKTSTNRKASGWALENTNGAEYT